MNRYFRRFAEGVFDEEDLRKRARELSEFVFAASEEYSFNLQSVYAVGYSNGANIGAAIALLHPKTLAGGVLLRAMVPLIPATSPELAGKRFSIQSGGEDPIVPLASGKRLVEMLKQAGATVEHSIFSAGHSIIREDIEKLKSWFSENAL